LGNSANLSEAGSAGRAVQVQAAAEFAASVLPILKTVQKAGATTLAEIAEALNERGIRSASGGKWHRSAVRNLLVRVQSSGAQLFFKRGKLSCAPAERFFFLEVGCRRCNHRGAVDLRLLRRDPSTDIWKLEASLRCEECRAGHHWKARAHIIKLSRVLDRGQPWYPPDETDRH
jgi:hypothetical protein